MHHALSLVVHDVELWSALQLYIWDHKSPRNHFWGYGHGGSLFAVARQAYSRSLGRLEGER